MSVDLSARRSTLFDNGAIGTDEQFVYGGNAQLDYHDKPDGKPGANHLELVASYVAPKNAFQQRTSGYATSSLRWTHSFTSRLSSVVKLDDLFGNDGVSIKVFGANYQQLTRRLDDGRRVSASLVCRLGTLH